MRAGAHRHTAHDLYLAKICYRYHPFYCTEVQVIRYLRRMTSPILVVKLPDGRQLAIPEWMLNPLVCEQLKQEVEPRIAIAALQQLRQLIDIQPLLTSLVAPRDHAESPAGGLHAQKQKRGVAPPTETPLRDRRSLQRTSRTDARKLSKSGQGTAGECSQRTEAK